MIEKLAHKLTMFVIERGNKKENYDIYHYGFTVGIELMISVIAGILIAMLFKSILEFIIFLALLIPLRAFAGGVHLGSFSKCFLLSTGVTTGVILLANYWKLKMVYSNLGIVFLICLIRYLAVSRIEESGIRIHYSKKLNSTIVYIGCVTIMFNIMARREWLIIVLMVLVIEFLSIFFEKFIFLKQI